MQWKFNLGKFEFQKKEMLEEYFGSLEDFAKQATREFIKAAAPHVPVDTGMARASLYGRVRTFRPSNSTVKAYLGLEGTMVAMARRRQPRDKFGNFRARKKWYYRGKVRDGFRTIPRGREMGLITFDAPDNLSDIEVIWSTDVHHFIKHEDRWQARLAGAEAFEAYVESHKKDLKPQLKKFVHYNRMGK